MKQGVSLHRLLRQLIQVRTALQPWYKGKSVIRSKDELSKWLEGIESGWRSSGVHWVESLIWWQVEQPVPKELIFKRISGHYTRYSKACYNLQTPKWSPRAVQCNSSIHSYLNPDPLGSTNYFALPGRWHTTKSTPNLDSIKKQTLSGQSHKTHHFMVSRVKLLGA